ncbi:MAG: DUF4350 domain-containing protein [Bacillota bacterium]
MSRVREWAAPAALLALLLVVATLAVRPQFEEPPVPYSTYNTRGDGLYGIYRFLEMEGRRPLRWRRPPGELPPEVDRLVVWAPADLDAESWRELEAWVAGGQGRTLIVAAPDLEERLPGWPVAPGESGGPDREGGPVPPLRPGAARPARLEPWTAGVREVVDAAPLIPRSLRWLPPARVYLADGEGHPAAVGWEAGPGRVVLFLRPDWLTNNALDQGDNLRLALGLLSGPPGSLAFSEYHHGLVDPGEAGAPDPAARPTTAPWRPAIGQLGAALTLYLLRRAARFGSPLPDPPVTPRAGLEFVHALGNLYRQARARQAVTQALAAALRTSLRRLGPTGTGDEALARLYEARTGRPAGELLETLRALESPRPPGEAALVALARRAEELQRRVEDGKRPGGS